MHIPGGFSGGFRPHKGYVERKNVEAVYKKLKATAPLNAKNGFHLKFCLLWAKVFKLRGCVSGCCSFSNKNHINP